MSLSPPQTDGCVNSSFSRPPVCRLMEMPRHSATQTLYFTHSEDVQKSDCPSFILLQIGYNQTPTSWGCVCGGVVKNLCLSGKKVKKNTNTGTFFSQFSYLHTSRHVCQRCKHRINTRVGPFFSVEGNLSFTSGIQSAVASAADWDR